MGTSRASKATGPTARRIRREQVRNLPRAYRRFIHGFGQWRSKVVNADGRLERP